MKQLIDLTLPNERWVIVKDTDGKYAVSDQGRVASFHKTNTIIMRPHPCRNGYLKVIFQNKGKERTMMPHRLVAMAFVDNPQEKLEVNHINGVKTDNRADNLEWVTRGENCRHAVAKGLHRGFEKGKVNVKRINGSTVHTSILNEDTVRLIRKDIASGMKRKAAAEKYKVKMSTIGSALTCWKHVI